MLRRLGSRNRPAMIRSIILLQLPACRGLFEAKPEALSHAARGSAIKHLPHYYAGISRGLRPSDPNAVFTSSGASSRPGDVPAQHWMGVLRRIAALLMSPTPGGRKRRGKMQQAQQEAIDLTADDRSSKPGKRSRSVSSRSSGARLGATAAGAEVVDITDSPPSASAAASPEAGSGSRSISRASGVRKDSKAARAARKAAEADQAAAPVRRRCAEGAAAAKQAGPSGGADDMFFRSVVLPLVLACAAPDVQQSVHEKSHDLKPLQTHRHIANHPPMIGVVLSWTDRARSRRSLCCSRQPRPTAWRLPRRQKSCPCGTA